MKISIDSYFQWLKACDESTTFLCYRKWVTAQVKSENGRFVTLVASRSVSGALTWDDLWTYFLINSDKWTTTPLLERENLGDCDLEYEF